MRWRALGRPDGMTAVYEVQEVEIAAFARADDARLFVLALEAPAADAARTACATAALVDAARVKTYFEEPEKEPEDQADTDRAIAEKAIDVCIQAGAECPEPEPEPEPAPPADDFAEAFLRIEAGENLTAVADDLRIDWRKLRSAWAREIKARNAEARSAPIMDAAHAPPRAEPRPVVAPDRSEALGEGWARCSCGVAFNAAKSMAVNKLPEMPTRCGGCRARKAAS